MTGKTASPPAASYRLDELAAAAGLPVRTIRFYIQRGLLPAPEFRGPNTVYSEEHRLRLAAIQSLQERQLPLEAIARELERATPADLAAIAAGRVRVEPARAVVPSRPAGSRKSPGRAAPAAAPAPARASSRPPSPITPGPESRTVWTLAPGLELHLAEPASAARRALARRLVALAARPEFLEASEAPEGDYE